MNKWPRLALSAIGLTLSMAGTAHAGLAAVDPGPYTVASGRFPMWYQDHSEKKLELCQTRAVSSRAVAGVTPAYMCLLGAEPGYDDTQPMVFPDNWPGELFWFTAGADIPQVGTSGYELEAYVAAVEAAFSSEAPVDGDQVTFARIRIRASVPRTGTYTITHPYGIETIDVTTTGRRAINMTRDIGIGAPGNFSGALNGNIGPFLQSVNGPYTEINPDTGVSETFVGDPNLTEAVTGSPNGTNFVRIQGPAGTIQTNLFTITGKVFDNRIQTPLDLDRSTYRRTSAGTQVEVFAKAPNSSSLCYRDTLALLPGTPPSPCQITMLSDNNGLYFAHHSPTGAVPPFVVVTASNPTGTTKPTSHSSKLTDVVKVQTARYDWSNHRLTIEATSSDEVAIPDLVAQGFGRLAKSGTLQQLIVTDLAQPPASITVKSAAGGADSELVTVVGRAPTEAQNGAPRAMADSATTGPGVPVTVNVLANDTDPESNTPLTVADLTQPAAGQGTVALSGTTAVIYTPPAVVNGPLVTTFTYRAVDSEGAKSEPTTVTVTVTAAANQAPVAGNDTGATQTAPVTLSVLANDTDPDNNTPLTVVNLTQPAAGQGSVTTNGTTVTYTPPAGLLNPTTATFTYQARDSLGALSAPATVAVNVTVPVNQAPVAGNDTGATQTAPITLSVLANDTDPEGNTPLTVVNLTQPAAGQGSVTTNGTTVTYTPPASLVNAISASFTYQARDSRGALSAPATVTVQVSPVINLENLRVTAAIVQARVGGRFTWDISGASGIILGNTITVQVATPTGLVTLGTASVALTGRWRLVVTNSIVPGANPTATARSSAGSTISFPVVAQ
ncbi:Ig-like domain-containing protein [Pseudomonas sp. LS1212]|uniref:Ig-like domain-containing protein n=1 Tax=Pseudomonas sp. LS1212 TaxID=2972478 RepID=UPI00215D3E16|nr:Ig-like domain-containing protein [Pseudomonas sp. LS1212]